MRRVHLILAIPFALLLGLAVQPALAQRRGVAKPPNAQRAHQGGRAWQKPNGRNPGQHLGNPGARIPNAAKPNANKGAANGSHPDEAKAQGNARLPGNLPGPWVQKLGQMSPQEQDRFLGNNQRFQSLPPEQQAKIRQNLQRWNNLPQARKDQISHIWETYRGMTPEQQRHYQYDVLPKWQLMPPARKQLIKGRLQTLNGMTPAERETALKDPQFMRGLSPDEQSTLRDLNSFANPARPSP